MDKSYQKHSLLGNAPKGKAFIVSAPAGTGKTTLVKMLLEEFPEHIVTSISNTTRPRRSGEVNDVHYHFLTEDEFQKKIDEEEFLEYVSLYGHHYGTSRAVVEEQQKKGKNVILVIDTQGALQLKGKFPGVFIFIQPPSLDVLRDRLANRRTETSAVVEQRLAWAEKEILAAKYYDYCIVNDDLQTAYQALRCIVIAEDHRVKT